MPLFGLSESKVFKMQKKGDVDGLVKALAYPKDPTVRVAAAQSLCVLRDRRTVGALIAALNDPEVSVRMWVSWTLLHLMDVRSENAMFNALNDEVYEVRLNAANMLSKTSGEHRVDGLLFLLADPECKERQDVVKSLGETHDERAVEGLVIALKDPEYNVNFLATEALGKIGGDKALNALIVALQGQRACMRRDAAKALAIRGDKRAVDPLIAALKDADSEVRQEAIDTLGQIGDKRTLEPLALSLKDPITCKHAAEALMKINGEKALDVLAAALQDKDWSVRKCAAESLGSIHSAQAVDALIPVLKDKNDEVRRQVALSLGEIADSRAIDALVEVFRKDTNFSVRRAATGALGCMSNPPFSIAPEEVDQKLTSIFSIAHELNLNFPPDSRLYGDVEDLKADLSLLVPISSLTDTIAYWAIYASTFETNEVTRLGGWETTEITFTKSNDAISNLCGFVSPVTSNILHLVAQKKDISVQYSEGCPETKTYGTEEVSFQNQRQQALYELERRGNPAYDIQHYKKR